MASKQEETRGFFKSNKVRDDELDAMLGISWRGYNEPWTPEQRKAKESGLNDKFRSRGITVGEKAESAAATVARTPSAPGGQGTGVSGKKKDLSDALLGRIEADMAFKKPEGWDQMTKSQKLKRYGDHLTPETKTESTWSSYGGAYQSERAKFLQKLREKREAGAGEPAGGADVGGGKKGGGYSGANGAPYLAGSGDKRNTAEYSMSVAREASDKAMEAAQKARDQKQAEADAKAWLQYYHNNYAKIHRKWAQERYDSLYEREQARQAMLYKKAALEALERENADMSRPGV